MNRPKPEQGIIIETMTITGQNLQIDVHNGDLGGTVGKEKKRFYCKKELTLEVNKKCFCC